MNSQAKYRVETFFRFSGNNLLHNSAVWLLLLWPSGCPTYSRSPVTSMEERKRVDQRAQTNINPLNTDKTSPTTCLLLWENRIGMLTTHPHQIGTLRCIFHINNANYLKLELQAVLKRAQILPRAIPSQRLKGKAVVSTYREESERRDLTWRIAPLKSIWAPCIQIDFWMIYCILYLYYTQTHKHIHTRAQTQGDGLSACTNRSSTWLK